MKPVKHTLGWQWPLELINSNGNGITTHKVTMCVLSMDIYGVMKDMKKWPTNWAFSALWILLMSLSMCLEIFDICFYSIDYIRYVYVNCANIDIVHLMVVEENIVYFTIQYTWTWTPAHLNQYKYTQIHIWHNNRRLWIGLNVICVCAFKGAANWLEVVEKECKKKRMEKERSKRALSREGEENERNKNELYKPH